MCFVIKQKTAYDVRISDWSSDVCSSDLASWEILLGGRQQTAPERGEDGREAGVAVERRLASGVCERCGSSFNPATQRSEEHTSELQSLMRISYAVFCLKTTNTLLVQNI